ncbi:MAG: hypothetical protein JRJ11_06365 [Deltaproteobacteria bacterium]|nr:hypothetical protein [Deltaproteobacteria bacterium]MBW1909150.1 hypothetical protein [Deltaproteobacteria bacterium]MBW2033963.1 hypothetical protein [Deltaproteobacteria bacterium]MBW2169324.1 hypothetical protein [Deltaproteobacteria bacterium]
MKTTAASRQSLRKGLKATLDIAGLRRTSTLEFVMRFLKRDPHALHFDKIGHNFGTRLKNQCTGIG